MSKIRIMVVDDHRVVRRGLAMALRAFDNLEFVGEAANGVEAIDRCDELRPDVILMDMIMPEMNGVQATGHIRSDYPDTRIIAMTASEEEQMVEEVLQAGADRYLLKNASIDDFVEAIVTCASAG